MAKGKNISRPPLTAWQVESLRLTAFPSSTAQIKTPNWWEKIVGEKPEKRTSEPRTDQQMDEGTYKGGKLVLVANPLRIDWHYIAMDKSPAEALEIPNLWVNQLGCYECRVDTCLNPTRN